MPIEVVCPTCQKTLRVGDQVAGKKIRCPACQGIVAVSAEAIVEVAEIYEEPEPEPDTRRPEPRTSRTSARSASRRPEPGNRRSESRSQRSEQTRPRLRKPQKARDYVHSQCGGVTTIDGPEFQALADPLAKMVATYCSECDDMFPIEEFAWDDTQERISDYYARYQSQASGLQNFMASRAGMFTAAGVAFTAGLVSCVVLGVYGVIAAIMAAVLAVILHATMISPMILRQVLGTNDPTQLE